MSLGDEDTRTAIQARHHGSPSRGISAPARSRGPSEILLWWRPERGEAFGYLDGWAADGSAFFFSGLGQEGDQSFGAPYVENGRLRDHVANGDRVRLLRYVAKNTVRYVGELRLDPDSPWQWRDGPDRTGDTRKIIQFRFTPVGDFLRQPSDPVRERLPPVPEVAPILLPPSVTEVESLGAVTFRRLIATRDLVARRRELELVHAFAGWLEAEHGIESTGLRIPYAPETRVLRADLYIPSRLVLVEAKASASREKIRQAIGQLLDYARWVHPKPGLSILVPSRVPDDMLDLLRSLDIGVMWPAGSGFVLEPTTLLS